MKYKPVIFLVFLGVLIFIVYFYRNDILIIVNNPEMLKNILKSFKSFEIPVYLFISAIRSVFFIPAGALAVVSGITFGTFFGTLLTCIGVTLSGVVAFYISRYFGHDYIKKILKGKLDIIDAKLKNKGMMYIAILRMIPVFPFDAVSYVSGIADIKIIDFTAGTFIGSIPGAFVYTYLGNNLFDIHSKNFMISVILVVIISIVPLIYKFVLRKG